MALPALQSGPLLAWFKLVNDTVTEPYLDEVFHVRQAQHYCRNQFNVWDPKITTPPGLYLLSYLISPIVGCDLIWLRCLNLFCITTIQAVITWTYYLRRRNTNSKSNSRDDWSIQHSALNVTLFPPLFFFAALYYTDVPSTLSVLIYYWLYLHFTTSWLRVPVLSLVGIGSLLFRQTNIFWVAIFPAGISLVQELDRGHEAVKNSMLRQAEGFGDSFMSVARTSWKLDVVYDARVKDSSVEDYIKTLISLSTCTLKLLTQPTRLLSLLPALAPPLITLSAFSAFIIWNGSVVLGDKTNHIATLHLPQLLYIWPYMTFFSWPLLYPYLLTIPFGLLAKLPNLATLQSLLIFKRRKLIPRFWLLGVMLVGACVVVRYNTIVHPFTLADNRHYTFYVFRLLMRPGWVRYAVTPVYVVCGWACVQALGARPVGVVGQGGKGTSAPSKDTKKRTRREEADKAPSPNQQQRVDIAAKHSSLPDGSNGATTSFVIIWLATTTLQLVTAPLVEPRYLILPWIFWRIHVPIQRYTSEQEQAKSSTLRAVDHRLWLETAWMLVINAATGYLFLYRGFEWPQEVGRVQRFMW